jgi:hypothetical protein
VPGHVSLCITLASMTSPSFSPFAVSTGFDNSLVGTTEMPSRANNTHFWSQVRDISATIDRFQVHNQKPVPVWHWRVS